MAVLRELLVFHNLVYLVPMLGLGVFTVLSRVGVEVDVLGGVDDGSWQSKAMRALFPSPDLRGVTAALFALVWASTGLGLNRLFETPPFPFYHVVTFLVACVLGMSFGIVGTLIVSRVLPTDQTPLGMDEFVGMSATVLSPQINPAGGRARIRDHAGNMVTVRCRHIGGGIAPEQGTEVVLAGYDPKTRIFDVIS
ncbi:MAG: DUF1449 family protein [Candidatus Poribacteria bacterium]|nr:DUF1449 family protein [Candidatus Poribacteria bacterium]